MVLRLNRTPTDITRTARNDINENWDNIERDFNNVVNVVSERAFNEVVDSARLIWQEPVDSFADLTTTYPQATEGFTSLTRDTGIVYRYYENNGWNPIQQIDAGPYNQLDNSVNTRLQQKITRFATVAAMKSDTTLVEGMTVATNSYRFFNDGGHGMYRIVRNDTLVQDNGSVHDLQNGLKAQLITVSNKVNVKQFGAYGGSGYMDDTEFILKAAEFVNTSLEQARSSFFGGGEVYFPAGRYICSQPLTFNVNVRLRGDGSRGFNYYGGRPTASIISFRNFTNRYQAAIKVTGYLQDGTVPTDYSISVPQADNSIMSPDNFSMIDMGIESEGALKISVGLNLVNATNTRLKRVAFIGFKYSILANCSWASSFENIFSVSTLGGILFTRSNASCSIRDSYLTVSNNIIPEGESVESAIGTMPHPNQSFGILGEQAYLDISNTIIERANLSIVGINSKINVFAMTNERIDISLFDAVNSNFSVDGYWIFNEDMRPKVLTLARNSNVALKNVDIKEFAPLIDADANSFISIINAPKSSTFTFNNEISANVTANDRTTSMPISFADGIIPTFTSNNLGSFAYKENKNVFFNLRCTTSTTRTIGIEFLVGQLPVGYRPSFEYVCYTKNGTLRITTTGGIFFNPTTETTFILGDIISYTLI